MRNRAGLGQRPKGGLARIVGVIGIGQDPPADAQHHGPMPLDHPAKASSASSPREARNRSRSAGSLRPPTAPLRISVPRS